MFNICYGIDKNDIECYEICRMLGRMCYEEIGNVQGCYRSRELCHVDRDRERVRFTYREYHSCIFLESFMFANYNNKAMVLQYCDYVVSVFFTI